MAQKRIATTLSIKDVMERVGTEERAVQWFEQVLWNNIPTCAHCGNTAGNTSSPKRNQRFAYRCASCGKRFTVRMGTVMESSRLPLWKWAVAVYSLLTARKGVSSYQLAKELGIQQKSAWFMLQRIREACQHGDFKLNTVVEIDECYVGGRNYNRHANKRPKIGQGMADKQAVLGLRQRQGPTKAIPVSRTNRETLYPLIQEHVEAGALVCTDEHGAYRGLHRLGYQHEAVRHGAGEYVRGMAHTNSIESVWAVLKRSLVGVYHCVSRKHLARYLNEATFRLNEGNCQIDTIDRMTALGQGMAGRRLTYRQLIDGRTP